MTNEFVVVLRGHSRGLLRPMQELANEFDAQVESTSTSGSIKYEDKEVFIAQKNAELAQKMHEIMLSKLDVDSEFVKIWGDIYKKVGRYEGEYYGLEGPLRVERSLYRKVGERNGPTVDPVSLRAGVVADGWLPRAAKAMAHLLAKGTSREAQTTSQELSRLPYSRTSFENVGHAVGKLFCDNASRIEDALIESYVIPAEARSISVSVDRVSMPMEEAVPKPQIVHDKQRRKVLDAYLRSAKERHSLSPWTEAHIANIKRASRKHRSKVLRNWRMAYCATITLHDKTGQSLHTIRYGRMPDGDVRGLMRRLAADVRALRHTRPDLKVVLLADGAAELWNLFDQYLAKRDIGIEAIRMLDCWHLLEYLGAAAAIMEIKGNAWPGQFRRWRNTLFTKACGSERILEDLRGSGVINARDVNGECPVKKAIRYLETRVALTRYATAKRQGLPIGSGNVEATCKSLVALRMKRPGARWKSKTGNEVLQLRALMLSDRWTEGIARALRTRSKPVKAIGYWEAKAA